MEWSPHKEDGMKSPKRRRPHNRTIVSPPPGVDLNETASQAAYVGSPEHKDQPSFAGQPRPRADASICDPELSRSRARLTRRLRESICAGNIGAPWEGEFPRYVWCKIDDDVYEARLVNRGNGEYKGYRLKREEWPDGIPDE